MQQVTVDGLDFQLSVIGGRLHVADEHGKVFGSLLVGELESAPQPKLVQLEELNPIEAETVEEPGEENGTT